jgi:alkylation response protein AidB-like acyl-CoA dehydrogenase
MAAPVRDAVTSELADLRDMVRALVAKQAPLAETRDDDPTAARAAGWSAMAAVGLLGIAVPEQYGGGGAGLRELAIVCEELARELVPAPFFATVCTAAEVLVASGDGAACTEYLPQLAAGECTATLARDRAEATRVGGQWVLSGELAQVSDGADVDLLIAVAETSDGPSLFVITDRSAIRCQRLRTLDMSRPLANIRLDRTPARLIGAAGQALETLQIVHPRTCALLATEQAAIAQRTVDITRQYLLDRRQFGRQIGAFQALKHRLADAAVRAELATSSAWYAIRQLDDDRADARFAAEVAAAACGEAALLNATEMIQLHGGIGYTWEHVAHRYVRRAKANQYLIVPPSAHRDGVGAIVAQ